MPLPLKRFGSATRTIPADPARQLPKLFAEKVAEYTDGRYEVQIFPSGQLANDPKAIELLQLGGIDFTVSATGSYATHLPSLNLTAMPFLVDTYEQGWELYDNSAWLQGEFDKLPEKGFRVLSTWEAGFRSFTTNEPLASPEDAKSMKMRVFPNDMIRWSMEAIGFQTVVMPITDVYLSIQQGIVNGQENPVDTINSLRFYEVAPNITLTRHVYSPLPLTIAEKTWQSFSDEDKEAVLKAAAESAAFSREPRQELGRQPVDADDRGSRREGQRAGNRSVPRSRSVRSMQRRKDVYGAEAVDNILADAAAIREALPAQN